MSPTIVSPSTVPTENIGSFYTPIDSPENSDEESQTMSRKREDSFLADAMDIKLTQEQVCHHLLIFLRLNLSLYSC